ncbi:MAG: hypothetical protein JWP00_1795 [Chloroflexi bacterium]|jgi:hypothetical protein|nr:hypothetical protein [Chloroflexota bacterium]
MNANIIGFVSTEEGVEARTEEGNLLVVHSTSLLEGPIVPW